jgi:hypothetical protein
LTVPNFRSQFPWQNAEPIEAKKKSFGFLIADKQEGLFRLEICWIKAYKKLLPSCKTRIPSSTMIGPGNYVAKHPFLLLYNPQNTRPKNNIIINKLLYLLHKRMP